MNNILKSVLKIVVISLLILLITFLFFFFFIAYSVEPWKKIEFSVLQKEDSYLSYNLNTFNALKQKYPELYKNDTCIIITSRAENDTVYEGSSPYSFFIRLWSYEEKDIEITKMQILNEDLKYENNNVNYSEKLAPKINKLNESDANNYEIIAYSTEYIFDLDDYQNDIKMRVVFKIDDDDFDSLFSLKRIERKGILRANI